MPTPEEQGFYTEAKDCGTKSLKLLGTGVPSYQLAILAVIFCMLVIASAVVRIADQPPDP